VGTVADASLTGLFRYHGWANARSFVAAAAAPAAARSNGITRTLFELLTHLTSTEEGYLQLLRGSVDATLARRRSWYRALDGDFARLEERSRQVFDDYLALLATSGSTDLERRVSIPWLQTEMSVREALLQVIVHSIEHRADVSTVLTQNGVPPPALDFVFWIADGRP
jgi:uncharacterized damage-inducible protein DinB